MAAKRVDKGEAYFPAEKNAISPRRLKKIHPELHRLYVNKLRGRRRPRILIGWTGKPFITFDYDWITGRTYASLDQPIVTEADALLNSE